MIMLGNTLVYASDSNKSYIDLNSIDQTKVDQLIEKILHKTKVPGASVVLLSGEQTKYLSYGYADKENNVLANETTLYELGSMSKAFTALGILLLEEENQLSLEDSVTDYIPWFRVHYTGTYNNKSVDEDVDLTIANLLYHTSGIPFNTLGYLPEGTSDDMLELTVKSLVGTKLDYYPGEKYQYATVNYDILGYIIQLISHQTYEEFIEERILTPLGLTHTYTFQEDANKTNLLAKGYKINFFQAKPYDAPRYRGNTPAGYIISNAVDMQRWMSIQMGYIEVEEPFKKIIEKSHQGNTKVLSQDGCYYAAGWDVTIEGNFILHEGSNPNYSSKLMMDTENQLGVCILTNMDTNAADYLAGNIIALIEGKSLLSYPTDSYQSMDKIFSIVTIGAVIVAILYLVLLLKTFVEILKGKRVREKGKGGKAASVFLSIPLLIFVGVCVYRIPSIMADRLPWSAVNVWASPMVMIGSIAAYIALTIFMAYVLLSFNFPRHQERGYIALIPLSIINGISSAMIIFTINESFNRNLEYSKELLLYFLLALISFAYTIRLVQGRMIVITNEIAYEKRMNMIDKIMMSSYQSIERIGRNRIFTSLNNDCAEMAHIPALTVSFISNVLTTVFCLSYLMSKSLYAFIMSLLVILINGGISFVTGRIASKYWEENRSIQDIYFGQMQDLVNGFKELVLNKFRRFDFWKDMKKYSRLSADLNREGSFKLLNFDLYNTLMYNIVFGIVVFVFPMIILDIKVDELRENLFIVFYMIGPFEVITSTIPKFSQLQIYIKRINALIEDLERVSSGDTDVEPDFNVTYPKDISVKFNQVTYDYEEPDKEDKNNSDTDFTLGPISVEFKSNQIVFITGGNGSGKSTLAKLITGLYEPTGGKILINGKESTLSDLNDLFSAIYTDFNLFSRLYGIDYKNNQYLIEEYIEKMKMTDKVQINEDGEFSTIHLSTGQKKRLAFIVSCLENKPMMLFDEWAAEQDPEFRNYFYTELLPMLKQQGKGIIVITHDDRYFDMADVLIKLERGMNISD